MKGGLLPMRSEVRLPAELAALREIRRRAQRHCVECDPRNFQTTLSELREALHWLEKLEQEAVTGFKSEFLPPANVHDRGE